MSWTGSRQCFNWQARGKRKRSFLCYLVDLPNYGKVIQVFGDFGSLPAEKFPLIFGIWLLLGAWRVVWWEPSLGCLGLESNSQASGTCRSAVWDLPKCLGGRSGFLCELSSLPTKEEQPGLPVKSKSKNL